MALPYKHAVRFDLARSEDIGLRLRSSIRPVAFALWLFLAGCATTLEVVEPGVPAQLGEGEAFLIIHIDTDVQLKNVSLESGTIASQLPAGDHLWIIRTRARRSGWKRINLEKEGSYRRHFAVGQMDVFNEDEFEFEIKAGAINYPGSLIVRTKNTFPAWPVYAISFRNRNHSAMAIRALLETHRSLLESLPIRYAGPRGDGFLDFYTRERDRLRSEAEARGEAN